MPTLPERPFTFDDEEAPRFAVGQVAEMLDVQPAFVRRLDTESVVQPMRSSGGQRRYTRHEINQVGAVSAMAGQGMTLPGIKRILALEAEVAALQATVDELRAQLDQR